MTSPFAPIEATLTDAEFAAIADAILAAYPDKDMLYFLLLKEWGVRVSDVIHTEQAGMIVVSELVAWARGQGRALDLVSVTWRDREQQMRRLGELARQWIEPVVAVTASAAGTIEFTGNGTAKALVPLEAGPPDWEDTPVDPPDVSAFTKLAGALCLVSVDKSVAATGFLIGRRTVLTTHSAVGHAIAAGLSGDRIELVLDGKGSKAARTMKGADGSGWIGPSSQAAQSELDATAPTSITERQLDFAVIRLAKEVPKSRPVVRLPTSVPIVPPGDAVVVLHHPMAGPLTTTAGTLIGYSRAGGRVTYRAETAPGSAGAPVFTAARELIALHNAAKMEDSGKIGQGVPIWRIRQAIVDAGLDPEAL